MSDIKLTVVMPIYNAYDYLRPALDSVIDQTLREIEIICIDDGSTDPTLSVLKEYQKLDSRVRIVTENNAGVSVARNKGLVRARGEYVIFLDADDFYELTLLERLYNAAKEQDLDITVCGYDMYNDKAARFEEGVDGEEDKPLRAGEVVSKATLQDGIFQSTTSYVWNKLFKTSFLRDKELNFAPELYVFEDVHFILTTLSMAQRIGKIDDKLIHHRIYSNQSRPKLFKKYYHQVPLVYKKSKDFLASHGAYIPLARSFLNVSVSRCYKIYNLLWHDAKGSFFDLLHDGYADALGWFAHEAQEFESEELYEFAASVGLYTHDQYKRITRSGRKHTLGKMGKDGLNRRIKSMRKRERFKLFLKKLFRIK